MTVGWQRMSYHRQMYTGSRYVIRFLALGLGVLPLLSGCPAPQSAQHADADSAIDQAPSFVNRVWRVEESTGMSPGQLVVFLSDGTLVFASPFDTPALGFWSLCGESLTMVEEGIAYRVEILSLREESFEIRSHNPGGFVDTRFVRAERPACPAGTDC